MLWNKKWNIYIYSYTTLLNVNDDGNEIKSIYFVELFWKCDKHSKTDANLSYSPTSFKQPLPWTYFLFGFNKYLIQWKVPIPNT